MFWFQDTTSLLAWLFKPWVLCLTTSIARTEQVGTILLERVSPGLLLSHPEQMGYQMGIQTSVPLQWKPEVNNCVLILLDSFRLLEFGRICSLELIPHFNDVNSDSLEKTVTCGVVSSKSCSRHYLTGLLHQLLILLIPNTSARKIQNSFCIS